MPEPKRRIGRAAQARPQRRRRRIPQSWVFGGEGSSVGPGDRRHCRDRGFVVDDDAEAALLASAPSDGGGFGVAGSSLGNSRQGQGRTPAWPPERSSGSTQQRASG